MFGLGHASMEWLFAAPIAVVGLCVFLGHLINGHILRFIVSGAAWWFFFQMHADKGVSGAMTATFAALLFDTFGLWWLGRKFK